MNSDEKLQERTEKKHLAEPESYNISKAFSLKQDDNMTSLPAVAEQKITSNTIQPIGLEKLTGTKSNEDYQLNTVFSFPSISTTATSPGSDGVFEESLCPGGKYIIPSSCPTGHVHSDSKKFDFSDPESPAGNEVCVRAVSLPRLRELYKKVYCVTFHVTSCHCDVLLMLVECPVFVVKSINSVVFQEQKFILLLFGNAMPSKAKLSQ